VRAAATVVPLAILATSCGGKSAKDPYAASLATGSEHVVLTADATNGKAHVRIEGSGDFTNVPDRGRYSFVAGGRRQQQVFANGRLYVRVGTRWVSAKMSTHTPQTPAQMFRAHLPAKIENGLVRSITVHDTGGVATYVFSKYGEHVSVTVPRVKGSK
jgi:hypothetical protein